MTGFRRAGGPGVERDAFADAATAGRRYRWGGLRAGTIGIWRTGPPARRGAVRRPVTAAESWPTVVDQLNGSTRHPGFLSPCWPFTADDKFTSTVAASWTATATGAAVDRRHPRGRCTARLAKAKPAEPMPAGGCAADGGRLALPAAPGGAAAAETWRGVGRLQRTSSAFRCQRPAVVVAGPLSSCRADAAQGLSSRSKMWRIPVLRRWLGWRGLAVLPAPSGSQPDPYLPVAGGGSLCPKLDGSGFRDVGFRDEAAAECHGESSVALLQAPSLSTLV